MKVKKKKQVVRINLAMTMAVKWRCPAATAEPIATLSAQTHSGYDAFSTLQPTTQYVTTKWYVNSSPPVKKL